VVVVDEDVVVVVGGTVVVVVSGSVVEEVSAVWATVGDGAATADVVGPARPARSPVRPRPGPPAAATPVPVGDRSRPGPAVVVLEAHDVVLAEVVAVLHLDEHHGAALRVLDAVVGADRDVHGVPRRQVARHPVEGHPRRAAHDEPVLGAPGVALVAEPLAGPDLDALDLERGLVVEDE